MCVVVAEEGWRRKGCGGCGYWEKMEHVRPIVFNLCLLPIPYLLVCAWSRYDLYTYEFPCFDCKMMRLRS